eukprot:2087294-Alexandrium_andersonii.AAC.1
MLPDAHVHSLPCLSLPAVARFPVHACLHIAPWREGSLPDMDGCWYPWTEVRTAYAIPERLHKHGVGATLVV